VPPSVSVSLCVNLWLLLSVFLRVKSDGEPALYESMSSSLRPTASQDWEWGNFTSHDLKRYINIGAYMNAAPYFVHESCPMSRSYSIFRNMGLRHLPVVDVQNQVKD
jgi:hypothetical protein